MKKIFTAALFFFLATLSALAATKVESFAAAKKKKPSDGILVYFYGPDWAARSTKMLKTFWDNPKIKGACGNAAMFATAVYQNPSEKDKKREQERRQGMSVPHIYSYPAVVMYNADGYCYYILQGDEILADIDTVAATIRTKLDLFRKQSTFLKRAEKAKGIEKAKLYGQAIVVGIKPPQDALKIIKANDPKGETPYAKRLEFNVYKLITDRIHLDKDKPQLKMISADEAYALVKKLAIDDETTYLPWQRQELLAACAAYLRRCNRDDPRISKLHTKIVEINPDSVWASFAEQSQKIYLKKELKVPAKKDTASKEK